MQELEIARREAAQELGEELEDADAPEVCHDLGPIATAPAKISCAQTSRTPSTSLPFQSGKNQFNYSERAAQTFNNPLR